MTGKPAHVSAQASELMSCGPLKTWSVLVTILGDLCTSPQDQIDGRVLTTLMEGMCINSQAVRVALHRLRRDGWIESTKIGRSASYSLTPAGWNQTQAVRPQIYSTETALRHKIWLAVAPAEFDQAGTDDIFPGESVTIAPRTALTLMAPGENTGHLLMSAVDPATIPGWAAENVIGDQTLFEYSALTASVEKILNDKPPGSLIGRTVLRLLVLHHWRRLRLRHGDMPGAVLAPDWPGAKARETVGVALERFSRPTLQQLRDACQSMA